MDDITIWAQAPGIRSIKPYVAKISEPNPNLAWQVENRFEPGKRLPLSTFPKSKMYGQPLKVTQSVKFLGVLIDNPLNMKLHVEHIERAFLISKMRITRLNSINATLLICLYKIFTRPCTNYACTALTTLNKTPRQKLKIIQNSCLCYAKKAVDWTSFFL